MENSENDERLQARHDLEKNVSAKEERKIDARKKQERSVWFGLGMFGLVGWSVALPTLIGVAIGVWIDHHWPSRVSWTLTLLILGLFFGCLNAWRWVNREGRDEG